MKFLVICRFWIRLQLADILGCWAIPKSTQLITPIRLEIRSSASSRLDEHRGVKERRHGEINNYNLSSVMGYADSICTGLNGHFAWLSKLQRGPGGRSARILAMPDVRGRGEKHSGNSRWNDIPGKFYYVRRIRIDKLRKAKDIRKTQLQKSRIEGRTSS